MTAETRPRVLLGDDYLPLLTALNHLLEPACEVIGQTTDGAALIDAALAQRPDIVLVDLRLPKVNGFEVCRRLRLALPSVKIVVLSAEDDPDIKARVRAAGAADFVPKRAVAESLLPTIQRVLTDAAPVAD